MESIKQFVVGLKDSLRVHQAFLEIINSALVTKRTLQITAINGGIYLGSVLLYRFFMATFFIDSNSLPFLILKIVTSFLYTIWLFIVYLVAMTLTTFWVQDIFDEVTINKLKRILKKTK